MRTRVVTRAAAVLALAAAPAVAQPAPEGPAEELKFEAVVAGHPGDGPLDHIVMVRAEESFETRLVKGSPYQAEAVNEFVQTLADGNRIVRRSSSTVARDSEGRTRREHSPTAIGPMLAGGPELRSIFINDPVAGVTWILEPQEKVARRLVRPGAAAPGGREGAAGGTRQPQVKTVRIRKPGDGPPTFTRALPRPDTEELGTKVIEGVEATGTRSTVTIPAGEMGNERPLVIVTERWFSPDLDAVVMSRHSDPRSGEATFRLTGISRSEPDRSLFEVPGDYTVKEAGPGHELRIERRMKVPSNQ